MKKCLSKMFTLFVATVLGISSGYVFSAQKGQNMPREEWLERGRQAKIEHLKAMNKPILFFGKVVDQFEKPVVGAAVVAGIAKIDPENPNPLSWWISVKEFRVTTDGDGLFDLKGHGTSLHINKIELPGYELDQLAEPTTFKYSRYEGGEIHSPDQSEPVVIHLRKKGKPAFMVGSRHKNDEFSFRLDPEKQPEKGIYLVKPWLTETGQEGTLPRGKTLKLNDRRKDETDLKFVAEWTADACVIRFLPQLTGSGIIVTDELLHEAPESGYEQEDDFKIQLPAPYEVRKHLYVKSEDGRFYSRIDVVIVVDSDMVHIMTLVWTNATGSRNLEYDSKYRYEENNWRRKMAGLRSASKRTQEEYVKKYKLKRAPGLKKDGKFDDDLFREDIKQLKAMRDKENPRWWHKFDKTP